jgi:hypothetical protein
VSALACGPVASGRRFRSQGVRSNEAGLVREDDGVHSVSQVELHERARVVRLDGGLGDDEGSRDLGVFEFPWATSLRNFEFARREPVEPGVGEWLWVGAYEAFDDAARDRWAE